MCVNTSLLWSVCLNKLPGCCTIVYMEMRGKKMSRQRFLHLKITNNINSCITCITACPFQVICATVLRREAAPPTVFFLAQLEPHYPSADEATEGEKQPEPSAVCAVWWKLSWAALSRRVSCWFMTSPTTRASRIWRTGLAWWRRPTKSPTSSLSSPWLEIKVRDFKHYTKKKILIF